MGYNGSGFSGNERRRSKFQNNSGARAEEASGHVTKTASPRHRMQRNKLSSTVQASRVKTDDPPRGKHHHGLPLSQSRVLNSLCCRQFRCTCYHHSLNLLFPFQLSKIFFFFSKFSPIKYWLDLHHGLMVHKIFENECKLHNVVTKFDFNTLIFDNM